jgi:hypothetical protein
MLEIGECSLVYENNLANTAPNKIKSRIAKIIPIAIQSSVAFAQLALLGFVPPLNAQTKSMMNPTRGMALINIVKNQSPVLTK